MWNRYAYCGNNPVTFRDSTGQYHKNVHFGVTMILALKAGFSWGDAMIIAQHCQSVDDKTPSSWNEFFSGDDPRHFPTQDELEWEIKTALGNHDIRSLGIATHPLEDSYSHSGLSPRTHWILNLIGLDPDLTSNNVPKALRMCQDVYSLYTTFLGKGPMTLDAAFLKFLTFCLRNDLNPIMVLENAIFNAGLCCARAARGGI
jgi:hypothetical protein